MTRDEKELNEYLNALNSYPIRDSEKATQGKAAFLAQAESLSKLPVSSSVFSRLREWIVTLHQSLTYKEKKAMFTTLASLLIAVTLALGGAAGTVYASQDSLPNDFLYPVKTLSEDVQLSLTNNVQTQLGLLSTFNTRRLEEMTALADAGESIPKETATRLQQHLDMMLNLAAGLDDAAINQALTQIRTSLQQQEQVMKKLQAQIPDHANPLLTQLQEMLQAQQRLVERGLSEPNAFRQHMDSAGNGPSEYPAQTPMSGDGTPAEDGSGPGNGPGSGDGLTQPTGSGSGSGQGNGTPQPPGNDSGNGGDGSGDGQGGKP